MEMLLQATLIMASRLKREARENKGLSWGSGGSRDELELCPLGISQPHPLQKSAAEGATLDPEEPPTLSTAVATVHSE